MPQLEQDIPAIFVQRAAETLADTNTGLSGPVSLELEHTVASQMLRARANISGCAVCPTFVGGDFKNPLSHKIYGCYT